MRTLRRYRILFVLLLLLLTVLPAAAQRRVDSLPAIRDFSAARFEIAVAINGELLIAGRGEMASPTRMHFVLQSLPAPDSPAETLEIVVYDGTIYTREGDDTQWYIEEESATLAPPTGDELSELGGVLLGLPVHHIQSMPIAGTPTDQYQIWISNMSDEEASADYGKLDIWIGQEQNYPYQVQTTLVGDDPEFGMLELALVYRFYAFEDPTIAVGPPAGAVPVAGTGPGLMAPLRHHGPLNMLTAPLGASPLRAVAAERLAR